VGFNDGYRVGWQDTLGGVSRTGAGGGEQNKKWSGDHCATATEISGGVFFSNRKINTETPNIMDLSPTVLKLLGVGAPGRRRRQAADVASRALTRPTRRARVGGDVRGWVTWRA